MTTSTFGEWSGISAWLQRCRESRRLVLVIVAIALLLDNMLLTTVVPIIPEFLYDINHPNATLDAVLKTTVSPPPSAPPTAPLPLIASLPPGCTCPGYPSVGNESQVEYLIQPAQTVALDANGLVVNITTTLSPEEAEKLERHKDLIQETVAVGMMFASKAFVQLLSNPIVGPLTHKIGYSIPMFTGFVIMFLSTLIFAFGRSYGVLFLARALQGIGSSCSSVSGMGMLAERYPDDKERGNAMGIALGGLALGVLIGPPFGGVMYEFVGKSAPFLVLSALALGDGLLQLLMLQPAVVRQESDPPSLKSLVMDPYILVAAGAITFANTGIAMLEPSLPIWMMDTMGAGRWKQGVTFLPASISYLIGTNLFGPLGHRMGRWLAAMLGLVIIGVCLMCIPLATSIDHLIVPNAGLGFAIGMVDSSMMPELGYLVDIRHAAVYGSVYAIGDVAFCLGFAIGPAMSGTLVNTIGFEWMLFGIAILNFLYAPLLILLRNPPTKEEKKIIAASVLVLATVNCQQYYQQRGSAVPEQYYEEQQAQSYQPRQAAAQRVPIYQSSAGGQQVQPAILMHKQQLTHDGGFNYAFAADNGLKQGESIAPDGTRQGQYSYVDPNGKTISVKYTAGKEGFRILEGAHIPKAPQPIQQQAQQVPQYQQQAAVVPQYQPQYQQSAGFQAPVSRAYGAQDDGQYRGEDSYQASGYSRPAASGYRPGPATFPPAPAYQPRYTQPRPLQYKAPVSNSVQQEPDYNVDPGKPHSFGSGYSFEFAG